jgi:hypothetical protein
MICPKCKSENVNVQMVSENILKDKHHSILWWLLFGWYWVPIKWLCLTIPALIVKIFGHKKQKIFTKHKSMAVCHDCGHHWNA